MPASTMCLLHSRLLTTSSHRLTALCRTVPSASVLRKAATNQSTTWSISARLYSSGPKNPNEPTTYDEFTDKYVNFFSNCDDMFDVQRGLNKAFSYDLVPSSDVLVAAIKACRKYNDYPTAVRIFEGLKKKLDYNEEIYEEYMKDLRPIKDEYGILTKEELQL